MAKAMIEVTAEKKAFYAENGYLLIKGLVSAEGIAELKERLEAYMYDRLPIPEGVKIQVEPRVERGEVPWPERRGDAYRKIDRLVVHDDCFSRARHHAGSRGAHASSDWQREPEALSRLGAYETGAGWLSQRDAPGFSLLAD